MSIPHATIPVQVWADCDVGIADMVRYLNTIDGVRTDASCQGTIGEGGPAPYRAQVMAHWTPEAFERLSGEFDVTIEGECWGYLHPREGWIAPATPDEQPQPVAWQVRYFDRVENAWSDIWTECTKAQFDLFNEKHYIGKVQVRQLYAHPPTSAASQPDAVRVREEMVEAACAKYHDAWELFDPTTRKWHMVFMRSVLDAALNPPAESSARGDVPNATPTSGGVG